MESVARSDDINIDFGRHLAVLRRQWWIVASMVGVAVVLGLILSVRTPPVYMASATVMLDEGAGSILLSRGVIGWGQPGLLETLSEVAKSRAVADGAVERLGVASTEKERVSRRIQQGLRIRRRGSGILEIVAQGGVADSAAATANAVAESFVDWYLDSQRAQASAARAFIDSQLATVGQELRVAEDALARYKRQGGQVSISEQTTLAVEKLAEFEAAQRAAAAERKGIEASLRRARTMIGRQAQTIHDAVVMGEDPVSVQLRQDLAKLEVQAASLREQYTGRHPQVIANQAQIAEVKARLQGQAAQTILSSKTAMNPAYQTLAEQVVKLEVDRQALLARENALEGVVARYLLDVQELPSKEVQLARFTRQFKVAEETYLLLSQKLHEAGVAEASIVGSIRIVDLALPPAKPVKPRPILNTFLALIFGLMAGIGVVFGREALDTTFRTAEEVGQSLGLPVLAMIPILQDVTSRDARNGAPLLGALRPRSAFSEAFRHLRTSLLYSSPDRPLKRILVTSPGPGEGKGTVAANLGIVLAQTGKQVLLIEGDMRKPALSWAFQPKSTFGLSELLVDGTPIEQAMQRTTIENLWFLPGGMVPPDPAELLGSAKMRLLLDSNGNRADVIVLDSPPLLPVTDAAVVAPMMDGIILVVRLNKTPRRAAERAKEQLQAVGAHILGVVVNGLSMDARGAYYEYGGYADSSKVEAKSTTVR